MNEEKLAKVGNFLFWFLLLIAAYLPFVQRKTIEPEAKPISPYPYDFKDVIDEVVYMRRESRKVLFTIKYVALGMTFLLIIAIALGVAAAF